MMIEVSSGERKQMRYCKECSGLMVKRYSNYKDDYIKISRKCKNCGKIVHTVELPVDKYNSSVRKLNQVIDILNAE
jgi:DNA-directed RNA polymerase subunit M/transcription elongation factor TFIIS